MANSNAWPNKGLELLRDFMFKITLLPKNETEPATSLRPLMVSLKSKDQLYSFYMPNLKNAGLFVPVTSFGQGGVASLPPPNSKIMMLLSLPDDSVKNTVTGKVVWISYANTALGAQSGVGVHFDDTEANKMLRDKIEKILAGILGKSEQRTMTI